MSSAPLLQVTDRLDIVKISVGPKEQPFAVHKHVLDTIPFFRACLNSPFQESMTKTVQMPEDDAKAFNEITQYAYSGHLSSNLILTPRFVNLDVDRVLHIGR